MKESASDLAVLLPDRNMEAAISGILSRPESIGIRAITFATYVHIERDPGCYHRGHDFLRPMVAKCENALVLFDRIGSGQEHSSRESLEKEVTGRLSAAGWGNRAGAVVIDPELEAWVWSDSPHVSRYLGWESRSQSLREWLRNEGLWPDSVPKPPDPKEAMERALRVARKPRSSAIYRGLAEEVSLQRCIDPALLKFRELMEKWFSEESNQ